MKHFTRILFILALAGSTMYAGEFKVNGVYTSWAQSQHAFTFDPDVYDDNYVVQMLRFNVQGIANENLKFVTRLDIAQGWWGVDNSLRSVQRTQTGGGSALFDYKDTNFLVHIDQAYLHFNVPNMPVTARVGRMWYGLGNKIMIDNNYDGIQLDFNDVLGENISVGWAKVSEGGDNVSDIQKGGVDNRDADLFTLNFSNNVNNFSYNAYGFFYNDASMKDNNAYVPDHLQFFKTRFSPQISQLTAIGLSGTYKQGKLTIDGEVDYLMGKDDIDNAEHGLDTKKPDLWDKNDGDLSGYNVYLKGNYAATDKVAVGGVLGMGSGDDDLTEGKGNVNKLRTSGFFYITEIWEDSIMPDEEGITPQGLGAPNVRGYRELENTTALQVNTTLKPFPKFSAFFSYTYLMATQPIKEWMAVDTNGDGFNDSVQFGDEDATDIGMEVDFNFGYKLYEELGVNLRGGYFMPGDAALYLINGHTNSDDAAWEVKGMITYKF